MTHSFPKPTVQDFRILPEGKISPQSPQNWQKRRDETV